MFAQAVEDVALCELDASGLKRLYYTPSRLLLRVALPSSSLRMVSELAITRSATAIAAMPILRYILARGYITLTPMINVARLSCEALENT